MHVCSCHQVETPICLNPCPDQYVGRTRGDQIVVFNSRESLIGELIDVQVIAATALTLHGVWGTEHLANEDSSLRVLQNS